MTRDPPEVSESQAGPAETSLLSSRIAALQDKLLQITSRNRSILLGTLHQKYAFDLTVLGESGTREAVRRVLRGSASMPVVRESDTSDEGAAQRRHMTHLARTLRRNREESGLRTGNLGFPFLVGALDEDTWVRAPLVLAPVRVVRKDSGRDAGWHIELREGTKPTANRALLAAIQKVRGLRLGDAFVEELEDMLEAYGEAKVDDWDFDGLLADLEDLLTTHGLTAPLSTTTVQAMASLSREDREKRASEGLHLEPHIIVGDFPQTNEPIHADYEGLREAAEEGSTDMALLARLLDVEAMAEVGDDPELPMIDDVPDKELGTVLASNGAQDEVLLRAQRTHCTVIRGPPGTGKSQVIANLVSDALRHGQKVLVVCQKRAALDVVHDRLEQAGLHDIALLVHDPQADRKATFERLHNLLEPGQPPAAPDIEPVCDEVDRLVDDLDALADLFGQEHNGRTLYWIYSHADPAYRAGLSDSQVAATDAKTLDKVLAAIRTLGPDVTAFRTRHPWRLRHDLGKGDVPRKVWVEERTQRLVDVLGQPWYLEGRDDLEAMATAFGTWNAHRRSWLRFVRPAYLDARRRVLSFLAARGAPLDDAAQWAEKVRGGLRVLDALDALQSVVPPRMARQITHAPDAEAALQVARGWLDGVADWDRLVQLDRDLADLPGPVRSRLRIAMKRLGDREDVAASFEQEVLHAWIHGIEESTPALRGDPFHDYERKRLRLQKVLDERRGTMAEAVRSGLLALARTPVLPAGEHHPNRKPETDWNQVRARLQKKRNMPTLRGILREPRFQHIWARSARCWLMSPEAVSAVHPLEPGLFDLVVFDEASQLAVERALPAVYRAKRIVVAGDEKQLPPFDLFRGSLEDEEEDLATDSLLSLSSAAFGSTMLEWHYRSEHQELVEFSNQAYYGGGLKVVPNPAIGARPIRFHRVDGRFIEQRNDIEAAAVVDLLQAILDVPQPPTLGVVTFNKAQRDLIEDLIEARADDDPDFARLWRRACNPQSGRLDDQPFVKNIENVQGDERDVIVFSTTYGPDDQGRVHSRFGVFNQRGGEHRLNVAITRARKQVHVVSSLDPSALRVETSVHLGPKHLKAYLEYACALDEGDDERAREVLQRVAEENARREAFQEATPLHRAVVDALHEQGLRATPLVGYSGYRVDVAVADPDDPERNVLAIELDGPNFRSARGARERDVARQAFLESRGWRVERIWSRNWFRAPDKETHRIVHALRRAR